MRSLPFALCLSLLGAPALFAQVPQQGDDEYLRIELLGAVNGTTNVRSTYDVTATTAGAATFVIRGIGGRQVSDISVIDRMTGQSLESAVDGSDLRITLARPVPRGGETRLRVTWTRSDAGVSLRDGQITFSTPLAVMRGAIVLPPRHELVSANVPVQVIEESDGRIAASMMNTVPGSTLSILVKAKPVAGRSEGNTPSGTAPTPPMADAPAREQPMNQIRVTERAFQDREIVYFLKEPDTHAFSLYHDYTAAREGEHQYVNVVRAGSSVSEPSAVILDTGEVLKTRTLTGADVVREKIDIPDRVEPDTTLVLIPFTPVKKGQSVRLRISETYTDPARYALVDGQLMWHRSFGRPRNDMVLPAGWYLTTSSIPAVISQEADGRIRLSFWNPRPDNVDVFVKARRR